MFSMAAYLEFKSLIDEVGALEDQLMPNELEMLHSLKAKYAEPLAPDPFDVTALEVMRRNVQVRKGYDFDPKKDGGRVIDLPRAGCPKKG